MPASIIFAHQLILQFSIAADVTAIQKNNNLKAFYTTGSFSFPL